MKLTLDVENTTTERGGKLHLDPFEPTNSLTVVGMLSDRGEELIVTFDHNEVDATTDGHAIVQQWLDETTVLICHNAAYDLLWVWESGFTYDGAVFDDYIAMDLKSISSIYSTYIKDDYHNYNVISRIRSGVDTLKRYMKGKHEIRIVSSVEFNDVDDIGCIVNSFLGKVKTEKLVINNYYGSDFTRLNQRILKELLTKLEECNIDNIVINSNQRKHEE